MTLGFGETDACVGLCYYMKLLELNKRKREEVMAKPPKMRKEVRIIAFLCGKMKGSSINSKLNPGGEAPRPSEDALRQAVPVGEVHRAAMRRTLLLLQEER